ncbi:hypothetical protein ABMA67_00535 [Halobacteriovorax sp. RZ-3]|uniref:hypothetical protein n=1 Tax=Halobacteriovorax sp. RZ-3 TaxID=3157720 RepID=UPI003712E894
MTVWIGYIVIILISAVMSYFQPGVIPWNEQAVLYKNVQEISVFLFGVMGLWLGLMDPESLKDIFNLSNRDVSSNLKRLKIIFRPIRSSTLLLVVTILVTWLAPYVKRIKIVIDNKDFMLNCSYFVLCVACMSLVWSLFTTLVPLDDTENDIENASRARSEIDDIMKNTK